jgi:hypothetical protein
MVGAIIEAYLWLALAMCAIGAIGVIFQCIGPAFPSPAPRPRPRPEEYDAHVWAANTWRFIEYDGLEWRAIAGWDAQLREHLREYQPQMRDNWLKAVRG